MHQDCSSNKMGQFPRKEQPTCNVTISIDKKQELIKWANETVITQDIVEKLLEDNSWHQSNSTNF